VLKSGNQRAGVIRQLLIGILIGAAITLIGLAGFPQEEPSSLEPDSLLTPEEVVEISGEVQTPAPDVGQFAPNFRLRDPHDRIYELKDFEGNIVLLNFWATWCGPCRLEMPLLEQHRQELADENFVILAVNLQESVTAVQAFVDEMGLSFPVLLDEDGHVSEQYRIIGYPSTIIIDSSGRIRTIHIGIISEPQLHEYLGQIGLSI
jgi:peroxiredoxin